MGRLLLLLMVVQWTCPTSSAQGSNPRIPETEQGPVKALVQALRFALVGAPTYHAKQQWEFDPEVAKRRSVEFQALNGYQSRGLIERLGLGEDGMEDERRREQAVRDSGLAVAYRR